MIRIEKEQAVITVMAYFRLSSRTRPVVFLCHLGHIHDYYPVSISLMFRERER